MKIWIIWTWYVWLIQALWLAKIWFDVTCLDIDENKINDLKNWKAVIFEPWLEELLLETKSKINFTTNYKDLNSCDIIFIAVWTPQDKRWRTNKDFIHKASISIKQNVEKWKVIVIKSTVPVWTNKEVSEILWEWFEVASNPEFLREWKALEDFFEPDRIVVGFSKNVKIETKNKIWEMYKYFLDKNLLKKSAKIIFIWSKASKKFSNNWAAYLASKFWIRWFAWWINKDLWKKFWVHLINPKIVKTNFHKNSKIEIQWKFCETWLNEIFKTCEKIFKWEEKNFEIDL